MSGSGPGHLRGVLEHRWFRHLVWVAVAVVASAVFALGASRGASDPWVEVGTPTDLRAEGAVYLQREGLFVVHDDAYPIAVYEDVPHLPGDRVVWCRTSRSFEEVAHGSKFDRTGAYMDGPARRGLDQAPVRVEGGVVLVDTSERITGPARRERAPIEPAGRFCIGADDRFVEDPPGIADPVPGS